MLETNIDDCSAEVLGYVMEKLMDYALDVFYTPIFMKKNRPAYKLSVLCYEKYEKQVESIIFKNTTSIGIRKYGVERSILDRKIEQFYIDDISVQVKVVSFEDDIYVYPEYETAKKLAEQKSIPIKQAYKLISEKYKKIKT
ncbi:MAG: DUF111 family protein [Peptostreptococcaceae bacterium]|jgi:UPF0272 protein amet_0481|nr:DUF111 family protein [Peptostreptococcaceae bacterium]